MSEITVGARVRIVGDGDGADGELGVVKEIYKSSRCLVVLDKGGFRNLSQEMLEVEVPN